MISVDHSRLAQILECFSNQPLLVVGDLMLDEFIWGRVERISPEAPVPVVEVLRETVSLGGAANVAANLAVLGARPVLVGVVGADSAGERLMGELQKQGISTEGVITDRSRVTSIKTRIIAQHQQVCRTDREHKAPLSDEVLKQIEGRCDGFVDRVKGIILSDYCKGVLTSELTGSLIARSRQKNKFLAVDPKTRNFSLYRRASIITPNKKEAEQASGVEITDQNSLLRAGRALLGSTSSDYLLITRGEEGMTLFEDEQHFDIPTVAREVFDVTGAGDTVVATLTLAIAAGASVREAAMLANHAAGVVVGKLGTAAATVEEIKLSVAKSLTLH